MSGETAEVTAFQRQRPTSGWRRWVYSTNHKDIGIIYLWLGLFAFGTAGALAVTFRTDLALSPDSVFLNELGYNSFISVHALSMIFFVILPLSAALANYFIPIMVGADEMAFPRLEALGAWTAWAGFLLLYFPFVTNVLGLTGMPTNAGWFQYPPLNTLMNSIGTDAGLLAIAVFGIGSVGANINFIVTMLNERRPDMGWFDIPIFIWGIAFFTPILALYSLPWLEAVFGMTWLERNIGLTFFAAKAGGDPLLYQWLFWTFGHPEVYVLVLPGMAIAIEIISRFSERPIFGYKTILASFVTITIFSGGVWAHHMYNTGTGASRYAFMVFSMAIVMAFGIYVFAAIATMWRGRVRFTTPMLFSIALVVGLIYSGMEGIMLGQVPSNIELHSTYFVVGHFHFTLFMVGVFGLIAGIYYWYPRITGRMYNKWLAKYHAATSIVGVPLLFMSIARLGELGMMRRYATYTYDPSLQGWHIAATIFAYVVASGQLAFFVNMFWSLRAGDRVEHPWEDLFSGQGMPSPEYEGFPYTPPTPQAVLAANGGQPMVNGGTEDYVADGRDSGSQRTPDGGTATEERDGGTDESEGEQQ